MRKNRDNLTRWTMNRHDIEAFSYEECYKDSTPTHFHTDFYEIYLFRAGDVIYNIHMQQYSLNPGDMLLIPPNVMHWPIIRNSTQPYKRMFLWINEQYLRLMSSSDTDLAACFSAEMYGYVVHLSSQSFNDISFMIDQLIEVNQQQEYGADLRRNALFLLIMLKINDACRNKQGAKAPVPLQSQRIHQVTEYINDHMYDPQLSLDSLADIFYVSKSTLSKSFMHHMGVSLHQYMIKRRMYGAHQMLSSSELPIKVAAQVGYADYSAFYRAFQKEFGYSPKLARKFDPYLEKKDSYK
ncbi:HTH-type transcriptional activator RhaS [bioreactor metagenome]|uniref:HTH-type transcriptional activator RhaS n=1 Tax=bioreactor metagenome TaxID=1076179 RepID=A0A645DP25_9ZZZZ